VTHHAAPDFWNAYRSLPKNIQELANRAFALLKADPYHPSLHFKKIGNLWSVRVGIHHRALGVDVEGGVLWFWIGTHASGGRCAIGASMGRTRFDQRLFCGERISADDLNYKCPRICPRCLGERAVWWRVGSGARHNWSDPPLPSAESLPGLQRVLAWQRPAVHECRCGLDLRTVSPEARPQI
jgi:hypothetical protein